MKKEPLTESYFYILLCLYRERCHGYGIMRSCEELSNGRVKIGSGTMYGAISNMINKNWIIELTVSDSRKRVYELTNSGKEILQEEITRLEEMVHNAHIIFGGGINQ